MKSVFNGLTL